MAAEMTPVRALREEDLPAVVQMIHALAAFHGDTARTDAALLARDALGEAPWCRMLVAERAGRPVGYANFVPFLWIAHGMRAYDMQHLYVEEAQRGTGVGRALVAAGSAMARTAGCARIIVGTAEDNAAAQDFYLSLGFEERPHRGRRFMLNLG